MVYQNCACGWPYDSIDPCPNQYFRRLKEKDLKHTHHLSQDKNRKNNRLLTFFKDIFKHFKK